MASPFGSGALKWPGRQRRAMTPPLVVDVDGTMTRPDEAGLAVDPRAMAALRRWDAPVVVATGKAFPYPVALCEFAGVPVRVVAENGGVVCVDGEEADGLLAALERVR